MPLQRGPNSFRANVTELMKGVQSQSRRKAINTIARKNGISKSDAQFKQAKSIAVSQARKKGSSQTPTNQPYN
jgi:hypothetical protein